MRKTFYGIRITVAEMKFMRKRVKFSKKLKS